MDVPKEYRINHRDIKGYQSFNGYQKKDVVKKLTDAIIANRIEEACHWSVELHISGYLPALWQIIIETMSKNINISNPYLPSWIWFKYKKYMAIIGRLGISPLETRNNQEMRNLFSDIIAVLSMSSKNIFIGGTPIRITLQDFSMENLRQRTIATEIAIAHLVDSRKDDKDLIFAANEIACHLGRGMATPVEKAYYWYYWIMAMEKYKRKNGIEFLSKRRHRDCDLTGINEKYYADYIWLIWGIILEYASPNKTSTNIWNEIQVLFKFFKWKYGPGDKIKKYYLIFHAFLLLKQKLKSAPIIAKEYIHIQVVANINQLYKLANQHLPLPQPPPLAAAKFSTHLTALSPLALPYLPHPAEIPEHPREGAEGEGAPTPIEIPIEKNSKIERKINKTIGKKKKLDRDEERRENTIMAKLKLFNDIVIYK